MTPLILGALLAAAPVPPPDVEASIGSGRVCAVITVQPAESKATSVQPTDPKIVTVPPDEAEVIAVPPEDRKQITVPDGDTKAIRAQPTDTVVRPNHWTKGKRPPAWKARDVADLEFVLLSTPTRPSEKRPLELRVFTPSGHLYQSLPVATSAPQTASNLGPLRPPPPRPKGEGVVVKLPVAGTSVTQRGLYGRWTVAPHFEGEVRACGDAVVFELLP